MEDKRYVQGRWIGAEEILSLRQWIEQRPQWSRKRLAKGLCEQWDWRDGRGRLKDFAARSLLLKLAATKQIELPPLQENKRRAPRRVSALPLWEEPIREPRLWPKCNLCGSGGSNREQSPGSGGLFYLQTYHYLGCEWSGEYRLLD